MRRLALLVYSIVLLCLVSSMWVIDRFDQALYEDEIASDYEGYTHLLSSLIIERLKGPQSNLREVLASLEAHYQSVTILFDNTAGFNTTVDNAITPVLWEGSTLDIHTRLLDVRAEAQTDYVYAEAVIFVGDERTLALRFEFVDAYSDGYVAFHQLGGLIVFILLGLVISVLMHYLYRYLRSISQVTHSVAAGRYGTQMPDNRFEALQAINADINAMSKALQHNAEENRVFLGALHHELRLPITRLRLAMDMALHSEKGSLDEPVSLQQAQGQRQLIKDMDRDLDDLIELSEEMLSLSRLSFESEDLPKVIEPLDGLLAELVDSFDDSRIQLQCPASPLNIKTNRTALERVLINLIGNSVKYAQQRVSVMVEKQAGKIRILVEDDGPGIPENELKSVFKPFYRVDKGRERSSGGIGLGLSIAKSLVVKLDGELRLSRSKFGGLKAEISLAEE